MNTTNHLLTVFAEECGEVSKECHKALRFGLDDKVTLDPEGPRGTTGPTNREKIITELNHVMAVAKMLEEQAILPRNWQDPVEQARKATRVSKYMKYARRVGALEPERNIKKPLISAKVTKMGTASPTRRQSNASLQTKV